MKQQVLFLFGFALLIIGVSLPQYSWSQLTFVTTTHQFGSVENWNNPVVHFRFVNNGDTRVRFLPTRSSKDVRVVVPPYPIPPGDSGAVKVTYYTDRLGPFRKKISVSHSANPDPVQLTLTGDISSFSPNAQMECPTVGGSRTTSSGQSRKSLYFQKGTVVDSVEKTPIQGANVIFRSFRQKSYKDKTKRSGKFRLQIPPGRYKIEASAQGYHSRELPMQYLKRNSRPLQIELPPKTEASPSTHREQPPDVPSPTSTNSTSPTPDTTHEKNTQEKKDEPTTVFPLPWRNQGEEETPDTVPAHIESMPDLVNGQLSSEKYNPNNIVFLIDVSVSMDDPHKLPWLRPSMKKLVSLLRPTDHLALIKYSAYPHLAISSRPVHTKDTFCRAIDSLQVLGMTDGVLGLKKAYEIARKNFQQSANNQIILATDGLFGEEDRKDRSLYRMVRRRADDGVKLSVVGFGEDQKGIELMKELAEDGEGNFIHITSPQAARDILIEEIKHQSIKHQMTKK